MSRATATAVIRRPIEDVFAILTDVEQTGRWFPGDVTEHWTSPPPHGVGSTRHAVVRAMGRTTENDAIVTAFEPPTRAAMRGTTPGMEFEATLAFRAVEGGSRVDVEVELPAHGAMRLVMPAFAAWYERQWRQGLARLTAMLEAGEL